MLKILLLSLSMLMISSTYAFTFDEAIKQIKEHDHLKSIEFESKSLESKSEKIGSWGDPMLKLAAKNFPKDSLKDNETPMTGIEFGLSQKMALTNKYGKLENAVKEESKSLLYKKEDQAQAMIKSFWDILIAIKRLKNEISIFDENLSWLDKTIKVSERLYANGKISQQALLDIKIRQAQMQSSLDNKKFELQTQNSNLSYLFGKKTPFDLKSVPWKIIDKKEATKVDLKELSLKAKLNASEYNLSASNLNYVPDITFSVGYTKRSNIDDRGDFVSASISFPIPTSSIKYANKDMAINQKYSASHKLNDYKRYKEKNIDHLKIDIEKIKNELKILDSRTIKFAESSRKITLKSYSLGEATYVELLQSEIKFQDILMKQVELRSQLLAKKIDLKYIVGEKLDA